MVSRRLGWLQHGNSLMQARIEGLPHRVNPFEPRSLKLLAEFPVDQNQRLVHHVGGDVLHAARQHPVEVIEHFEDFHRESRLRTMADLVPLAGYALAEVVEFRCQTKLAITSFGELYLETAYRLRRGLDWQPGVNLRDLRRPGIYGSLNGG